MNKIYRLVWDCRQGALVAVQENAASRGKGSQAVTTGKGSRVLASAALVLAAAFAAMPAMAAEQTTYAVTVNDGTTAALGTLRWAVDEASSGSTNTIAFSTFVTAIDLSGSTLNISNPVSITADHTVQITNAAVNLSSTTAGEIVIGKNVNVTGVHGTTTDPSGNINGSTAISGTAFSLNNAGIIRGGNGGERNIFPPPPVYGHGGHGVSGTAFTLVNSGTIAGGTANNSVLDGSSAVTGSSFTLFNSGTITANNFDPSYPAISSNRNSTIYNSGTINAGTGRAITFSGGGNKLVLLPNGIINGSVHSNSGTTNGGDTLTLGGDSGSPAEFMLSSTNNTSKYVRFANFTKEGTGTWVLKGEEAGTTNNWVAHAGTLVLADQMSMAGTLSVLNGAAVTANNASIQNAVNNAGTFSVISNKTTRTGAYTNTGTLRIGVASMTDYGKLVVNGTATLGGTLFVDAASATNMSAGTLSQIISATSLSGTFANTSTNSLLFTYTPDYVGNTVNLTIAATTNGGGNAGGNIFNATNAQGNFPAAGAANALDSIIAANPGGSIASLFHGFTTGQEKQLSNAVSQTLPLLVGGSQVAANSAFTGINRVVQARLDGNRGLSSGDEFLGDRNIWFKPFGSWAKQGDRNGVSGFKANTYGVVAGIDRPFSTQMRAGVAFAYARSTIDSNSSVAVESNKVDVFQLIGYGSYNLGKQTELSFQGDISRNANRGKRHIAFTSSVADSAYDSTSAHAGIGISRSFAVSEITTFTPGIRADYTWIRDAAYAESGAGALNLNVNSRSAAQFVVSTDAKLNLQINPNTQVAFNAGVGYDTINKRAAITSAFAGAPTAAFVTDGMKQSPWIGNLGAGLTYTTSGGTDLTLRYDVEARSSFTNQTASAKVRWRF